MTALPQPDDLTSLVLRTDFTDDAAWEELRATLDSDDGMTTATIVDDLAYADATVQMLVQIDAAADDDHKVFYVFLADTVTMTDDERPLLAVDLFDEPGLTFRVPPAWYADVSANLSIANMDFAEFANAADETGRFRGFDR